MSKKDNEDKIKNEILKQLQEQGHTIRTRSEDQNQELQNTPDISVTKLDTNDNVVEVIQYDVESAKQKECKNEQHILHSIICTRR